MSHLFQRRHRPATPITEIVNATSEQQRAVEELINQLYITTDKLRTIQAHFMGEMVKGLQVPGSTVAMIPSYVEGRLDGKETGTYLALDLGGTNLRVVLVNLKGNGEFSVKHSKYKVSEELKVGEGRNLFDFIADCVDEFINEHDIDASKEDIPLGFTFSFPINQTAINRGTLMSWTKGFNCPGVIGKDPVLMLQDSFARKTIPVYIAALVNDTVGTLLTYAYKNPDTMCGVILGTGMNAAYVESMSNITKWEGGATTYPEMIINMECGAFDNERQVLPVTPYDNKLDRESINPRMQMLEKLTAGMYLGEIVRNALLYLIDRDLLFNGLSSIDFNKQWSFETAYMSTIEADATEDLSETKRILESTLSIGTTTLSDRQIVKKVCELVGTRAARLSAAMIGGIVAHTDGLSGSGVSVGIDGSLYEFYPNFEARIYDALRELFGHDIKDKIRLGLARDGSGVGAALVGCVAMKARRGSIAAAQ